MITIGIIFTTTTDFKLQTILTVGSSTPMCVYLKVYYIGYNLELLILLKLVLLFKGINMIKMNIYNNNKLNIIICN